jgi:uncharacterized membrane protein
MAMGATVPPPSAAPAPAAGLTDNMASAIAYLLGPITGIFFLAVEPYNRNARIRFHAWQSIAVSVAWFIFWVAASIIAGALTVFAVFLLPIFFLLPLAGLALWLFLMWKAYQGEIFKIPLLGEFAAKQAGV